MSEPDYREIADELAAGLDAADHPQVRDLLVDNIMRSDGMSRAAATKRLDDCFERLYELAALLRKVGK